MSYKQYRWQTTDLVDVLKCDGNVKYSNFFLLLQFVRQSRLYMITCISMAAILKIQNGRHNNTEKIET
jgi:hypothetical protein